MAAGVPKSSRYVDPASRQMAEDLARRSGLSLNEWVARLMAEGKAAGRPRNGLNMIIASVAGANDCIVVTANERDFTGLTILNPLRNREGKRS